MMVTCNFDLQILADIDVANMQSEWSECRLLESAVCWRESPW
jgi:hypothetical protein